jgi:LmbE family N-acetylglucosaminyl deacetylase
VTEPGRILRLDRSDHPGGLRVLAIGAHADDIEIGCGGTLLRLAAEGLLASVRWMVLSATDERAAEARAGCRAFLEGVSDVEVVIGDLRDGYFPYLGGAAKDLFEAGKDAFEPDLIFTHRRDDLHQDHRLVGELTWNTYRRGLILEYEIAKYEGDLTTPNLYIRLSREQAERKVELINEVFASQRTRRWFDAEAFRALLRLRGMESGGDGLYAEGFTVRKALI